MYRKNAWEVLKENEQQALESFAKAYCAYLDAGKTERECVKESVRQAKERGFEDLMEIVKLGVLSAPSLMVDGKLVVSGKVASQKEIVKILKKYC